MKVGFTFEDNEEGVCVYLHQRVTHLHDCVFKSGTSGGIDLAATINFIMQNGCCYYYSKNMIH